MVAVGGVGGDEGGAAEAGVRLRADETVWTVGAGEAAKPVPAGLPAWRGRKPTQSRIPHGVYGTRLRGRGLEAGVLGVGVEVGVGVHLVEFGAFFLYGLADQAEGQARRVAFPG